MSSLLLIKTSEADEQAISQEIIKQGLKWHCQCAGDAMATRVRPGLRDKIKKTKQ